MEATKRMPTEGIGLNTLKASLASSTVVSKQFIREKGLVAAIVDDNHLYDDEAHALMNAFQHLGMNTFTWCKTSDILDPANTVATHIVNCKYDDFLSRYMQFDDSIQYWDRLMYLDELNAIVLHTAHDHIIYAGSQDFVDQATQRTNQFSDGWLSIVGQAFSDPELVKEYGLTMGGARKQ